MGAPEPTRRPIASRNTRWAQAAAQRLARWGIRPNTISVWSAIFAGLCGASFILGGRSEGWAASAYFGAAGVFIQLRLLANLFDGMVAVEGGFKTKSGEIFNEFPDRVADVLILAPAGYASLEIGQGVLLGWGAAIMAVMTAYARALGAGAGASQHFCGPMAKQQRMFIITMAAWVNAGVHFFPWGAWVMPLALGVVIAGCFVTTGRRLMRIVQELESV